MKEVKVLRNFTDLKENKNRKLNEIFEATEDRIEEINSTKYGALVEVVEGSTVEEDEINIEDLTVAQIKELLDQMEIEYNSKMKKDELIALIEEGD